MAKNVVVEYTYAAVVKREDSYDVWVWNVWKLKWTRKSNHACGFSEITYAKRAAREYSKEIEQMLNRNTSPPDPLK